MCDIMEELFKKENEKERKQQSVKTARRMLAGRKLTLADIAEYSDLSLDEVKRLAQTMTEPPPTEKGNTTDERGDFYRKSQSV